MTRMCALLIALATACDSTSDGAASHNSASMTGDAAFDSSVSMNEVAISSEPCAEPGAPAASVTSTGGRLDLTVTSIYVGAEHVCAASVQSDATLKLLLSPCPEDAPGFWAGCFDVQASLEPDTEITLLEVWSITGRDESQSLAQPVLAITVAVPPN